MEENIEFYNKKTSFLSVIVQILNIVLVLACWSLIYNSFSDPYKGAEGGSYFYLTILLLLLLTIPFLIVIVLRNWSKRGDLKIFNKGALIINTISLIVFVVFFLSMFGFIKIDRTKLDFLCSTSGCHSGNAINSNNVSKCENITDTIGKSLCYYEFSYHSRDLKPCNSIKVLDSAKYNDCVARVAMINHEKSFCLAVDEELNKPQEMGLHGYEGMNISEFCNKQIDLTSNNDYSGNFQSY